ncbi:PAS domain-containing protein [Halobellus sp. Atlit-31R]|nr:PAS domain-containing protein [Halobellus sp. Atlit-31R]
MTGETSVLQAFPWVAIASIASGVVSVGFLLYLWPYRDRLGGRFFIATIGCEALWALSYGVALFVFDPVLRRAFEVPIWLAINFIGVCFLAFALEYTGRTDVLRSKVMGGIVGLQVLHTLVVVTNPWHHVAWRAYRIEPTFGLATVTYTHQPWLFVNAAGFILMIGVASFLLADTVFSYGPLYRTQAAAIAISPIFPGLPFLFWLAGVGITPPLNLTPLLFPIHLVFDMYAFFSRDMFELVPAARRIADRRAIDNLGTAVLIVDAGERIIELNDEAARVLETTASTALGQPLASHLTDVDLDGDRQTIARTVDGRRREYAATTSPLTDASGTAVGDTIVLQDITEERRREQRLAVLNRVLRHNLRNDLNVVQGYLDIATDRVDDPELRRMLETAETKTAGVVDLGAKARTIERVIGADGDGNDRTDVRGLLEDSAESLTAGRSGEIRIDVPSELRVRAAPSKLAVVFENVLENALEHSTAEEPTATVRVVESDSEHGPLVFEVADDGPGIPEHELGVLDATEETALEHGSGLGLWIVKWGVAALGGSVEFDVSDTGTVVRIELPASAVAAPAASSSSTDRDAV